MANNTAETMLITSAGQRMNFAASATSTAATARTPDYHLPWTGPVVEAALQKIMDLDLHDVGGVKVIDSTSTAPANMKNIIEPGQYVIDYVMEADLPEELRGVVPITLTVFIKDGVIYQIVEGLGNKYVRWSTDDGATWSVWSNKTTNGPIDISGSPSEPVEDPFDQIKGEVSDINSDITGINNDIKSMKDDIDAIKKGAAAGLSLSTTTDGQKMIDGTYDYPNY